MPIDSMDQYEKNPDGRWVMELRDPIVTKNMTVDMLEWRAPRAKDLRGLKLSEDTPFSTVLTLAEKLTGQSTMVIDKLSGEDLAETISVAQFFLDSVLMVGK